MACRAHAWIELFVTESSFAATSPDKDAHGGSTASQDDDELRLR
jgi:hypothetical protein